MLGGVKMIDVVKMVDRNYYHLEMLNRMRVSTLEYNNKNHKIEYEINDGKIVAEVVGIK